MTLNEAKQTVVALVPRECRSASIAYIDETPYELGETISIDGRGESAGDRVFLGFIDCEAGSDWAHRCMYVRCHLADDRVEAVEARLPPRLHGTGRRFKVAAVGPRVSSGATLTGLF